MITCLIGFRKRVTASTFITSNGTTEDVVGELSPDTVKNDVFKARITDLAMVDDPPSGLQVWVSFDGFPDLSYDILGSPDLLNWTIIGSEIATYRSQVGVLDNKTLSESRAMSKIVSADVAEETTRLAKNLLLRDASSSILAQARVNAANVYKSLL